MMLTKARQEDNKLKYSFVYALAMQIKNPVQLIVEILKTLIKLHEAMFLKTEAHENSKKIIN
jgi:hypothetical protein